MTLKDFLIHCKFFQPVEVYFGHTLLDRDSAFGLLHTDNTSIMKHLDSDIDYFLVNQTSIVVVVCN